MSQQWNGKALIDYLGNRLWDTSTTFRGYIIQWINEIQSDIAGSIPLDYYLFKTKKLLTDSIEIVDLNPQIPSASSVAIASGGSLVENSVYKVYSTFIIWDEAQRKYVESEKSLASAEVTATASDNTINVTDIDLYDGTTTLKPNVIWRRIYLAVKASGETVFSEPLFIADIEDNTTTTLSITAESTSTITPPSYSELSQVSSKPMYFNTGAGYLQQIPLSDLVRSRNTSDSTNPSSFDYSSNDSIFISPKLSSSATTDQKTLSYFIYRRPHEVFYESTRPVDMPIEFRKALLEGVVWKAYEFRDRSGKESIQNNYELYKKEIANRFTRQKGRPKAIRDVNGDAQGWEV